ncbi:MAG: tRNA (N6-isopentenyl adenosine(37)-C2)-methylthiotransferase MiaB [Proteobacteria bacterium]|nr:tRNA (N6-isopentenyl adenosine(37)-C2)-methylthiotransferase MiaB [Pseudomonadota bacterium]
MTKKLYIKTYGCQMNTYDSEQISNLLSFHGYSLSETPDDADVVILNTCHIREKATEKVFSDLGRLKPFKQKKEEKLENMILAVAGCTAQAEGAEIMRRIPYVDLVLGPQTYHRLPEMLAQLNRKNPQNRKIRLVETDFPVESKFDFLPEQQTTPQGSSAFLTIQEGCDKFCTFCCVPYTRGAEFSRPSHTILQEARLLVSKGVQEITLLGQNVNAYHGKGRLETEEWGLGRLLLELAEIPNLKRLRYTTSHPRDVDDELILAHKNINILMPFLHLPVQSGSDAILKAMNRGHTADFYRKIIDALRNARPDIAFSSDFIVGFPGETNEDFAQTLKLVNEVDFAQAYSFAYSIRPGTPAGSMGNQIPQTEKEERLQILQHLLREQQIRFNNLWIDKTFFVLFDRPGRYENQYIGRSPYLQPVHVRSSENILGKILPVKINSVFPNSLEGQLL